MSYINNEMNVTLEMTIKMFMECFGYNPLHRDFFATKAKISIGEKETILQPVAFKRTDIEGEGNVTIRLETYKTVEECSAEMLVQSARETLKKAEDNLRKVKEGK